MEGSFTPPTVAGTGQSGFEETPPGYGAGQSPPNSGGTPPPLDGLPPQGGPPPFGGAPVTPIPWEEPGRPVLVALVETVQLIYTRCSEAFGRMPLNTELLRPILFAMIVGMIGAAAETVYDSLWSLTVWKFFPGMQDKESGAFGVVGNFVLLFFMPLIIPVLLVISSAVTHVMLLLLGAGKRGWTATFRVSCYSYASALLMLIPLAGGLASGIAGLIFGTHGLAVVHGTSRGRALAALLLPVIVCCGCLMLCVMVFGTALLAGFKDLWNR